MLKHVNDYGYEQITSGYIDILEWVDASIHPPQKEGHYIVSDGVNYNQILLFKKYNIHSLIFTDCGFAFQDIIWHNGTYNDTELTDSEIIHLCNSTNKWFYDGPYFNNGYEEDGILEVLKENPKFYLNKCLEDGLGPIVNKEYPIHIVSSKNPYISPRLINRYDNLIQ